MPTIKWLTTIAAVMLASPMLINPPTATAKPTTTINCQHIGPIASHPGMEYVCYAKDENDHRETFYAPGPKVP
jgi:hypothetical protein